MITHALRALRALPTRPFRRILWLSLSLTLALVALLATAVYGLTEWFAATGIGWLDSLTALLAGAGVLVGLVVLIPPVAALFAGLFLDNIAALVETHDYPDDPPGKPVAMGRSLMLAARFTVLAVVLNIAALPVYLFLPALNLVLFCVLNGYLLGREYFELAASRTASPVEVDRLRRTYRGRVFMAGVIIALPMLLPVINLLTPLFATAFMVHVHKALARPSPAPGSASRP